MYASVEAVEKFQKKFLTFLRRQKCGVNDVTSLQELTVANSVESFTFLKSVLTEFNNHLIAFDQHQVKLRK